MSKLSTNLRKLLCEEKEYFAFPPFPDDISLEVFSGCNHECIFCPNRRQTKIAPVMPLKKAKNWLKEAYSLGARKVGLYAKGEPYAVKNIDRYIAAARKIGFQYIYLTTNGALADKNRLVSTLKAGLSSLKFSINGMNRKEFFLIHGKDDFDRVISNLKTAINIKKELKFNLYISIVRTSINSSSIEEFINTYKDLVDEIIVYECSNFCGYMDNTYLNATPTIKKLPCNLPFSKVHVTPEGYMAACCGDYENYLAVADLNKMSMLEAWRSDVFALLRKKHIAGDLRDTICNACIYKASEEYVPLNLELANRLSSSYWSSEGNVELLKIRHALFGRNNPEGMIQDTRNGI